MKQLLIPGALCALLICSGSAFAQTPSGTPASPENPAERAGRPDRPKWDKPGRPDSRVPGLDREEAQRFAAAREKAKNDPTVRSLKEARDAIDQQLESAMNAAMLAADPALAPTLGKVKQSQQRAKDVRDRFQTLSPEEKEQIKTARQAAQSDPAVVAARAKIKSADSPEARREAGQAMHEAMKAAMLKQNPDLAPLLERLGPPRGPKGPPRGADREE